MARRETCECYSEVRLPQSWEEAVGFDWMGVARDSLTSIMPETGIKTAAKFLARARFALFISRALDAIRKGGLGSYRRQISQLLSRVAESSGAELEAAKERASRGSADKETLNRNVQRVKAAYALREAGRSLAPTV